MPSSRLKVAGAAAAAGVWAISHEPDVVEAEGEGAGGNAARVGGVGCHTGGRRRRRRRRGSRRRSFICDQKCTSLGRKVPQERGQGDGKRGGVLGKTRHFKGGGESFNQRSSGLVRLLALVAPKEKRKREDVINLDLGEDCRRRLAVQ